MIKSNVDNVMIKLKRDNVDMASYEAFVAENVGFLEKHSPKLVEEMHGIADGSGVCFKDITLLNIPVYYMTEYFTQECSMLMVRGKATVDGCTYLAKNRDMRTYIEQAVIKREASDGSSIIEVSGAGTISHPGCGMNSHGLAVATTGFWSKKAPPKLDEVDSAHIFVNIRFLLEECKTAKDVLEYLKTFPRMNGLNITAVDKNDAFVIETTRDGFHVDEDKGDGVLYRSNHYILPQNVHMNRTFDEYQSTYKRYERFGELLKEYHGRIRFQDILRIMSDHKYGVNSICRHPEGDVYNKTMSTSIIVLEDEEMWTSIGYPCESLVLASI